MSEAWQPSIGDITRAFVDLADRLSDGKTSHHLDGYTDQTLRDAAYHLEFYIPGLDPVEEAEAARAMARAAQAALDQGDEREALARALRGLSFSPHDPALFYIAACACFEYGAVEAALRLLYHVLWIHPGHRAARADLEAMSAFLEDPGEEDRAA